MKMEMKNSKRLLRVVCVSVIVVLGVTSVGFGYGEPKISKPGEYSGYSAPIYNEWVKNSQYVTVRDGTKLAIDIYRPAVNGVAVNTPYPVLLNNTRYHRNMAELFFRYKFGNNDGIFELTKYGYVVAILDARGTGASYGSRIEWMSHQENLNTYDVIEWLGHQSWSNGNVGMWAHSYMGTTQYAMAIMAPPSLKAIMPWMPIYDAYELFCPGGVYENVFSTMWMSLTQILDLKTVPVEFPGGVILPAAPVDEDVDGSMLTEAISQHLGNTWIDRVFLRDAFRNTYSEELGIMPWIERSAATYKDQLKASGIPIYHVGGWMDISPKDLAVAFHDLKGLTQKFLIGPWYHDEMTAVPEPGEFLKVETRRWYDYWLKGIDNGIMDEQPIYYHTKDAPAGAEWQFTSQWPLPNQVSLPFYLHGGHTGTVQSVNDGKLMASPAGHLAGQDHYTVDYTYGFGPGSRWGNAYAMAPFGYGDMTDRDEKGLTYTSAPLPVDVQVTGHPVAHLWVNSTAADGDFFVVLEEVDRGGISHYITEGVLRASHRATMPNATYDKLGIPYHRSFIEDAAPLTGAPTELAIDLFPTSYTFKKGNRIRVTMVCAERDAYMTPEVSPAPIVTIYRDKNHASFITLPIIPRDLKKGHSDSDPSGLFGEN